MKNLLLLIALVGLSMGATSDVAAQGIGHLNYGALLAEMPKVKQADAKLEELRKQLVNRGESMAKALQTKYQKAVEDEQAGKLSPVQRDQVSKEIEAEQQRLLQEEKSIQQKLLTKRQELLSPILKEIENAVNSVAAESGYSYVIDASSGALLYASESNDIMAKVKAKLNM